MKNIKLNQEFNMNKQIFKRIFSFSLFKKNDDNKRSLSKRSTTSAITENKIKYKIIKLALTMTSLFFVMASANQAQAQIEKTIPYEPKLMDDGTYEFDIAGACRSLTPSLGTKICVLVAKNGIRLKITFGPNSGRPELFDYGSEVHGYIRDNYIDQIVAPVLESTHPMKTAVGSQCSIKNIERINDSTFYTFEDVSTYMYGCRDTFLAGINLYGSRFFSLKNRDSSKNIGHSVSKVYVSPYMTSITPVLITDANTLLAYYRSNLDTVYRLQGTIGKTFRPMAARLYSAIYGIVKMMSSENEENPLNGSNNNFSKLPITHDSIREQSRLIMVLAEVIVAMIKDEYGDTTVPEMKNYIDTLLPLSNELRQAFGWETGVAGKGSKVIASISTVIEESLKSLHEAVIFYNLKDNKHQGAFNELVFRNIVLKKAVLAREQGDSGAMKEVIDFQKSWNSTAWQEFMTNFLKDPKNKYLSASFKTLLAAVSSLQDFKTDDNNNKLPFLGLGLSTVENK